MQTDNQPPLSLPGGGSLTLPAMSGGNTPPTPQSTTTTQQSGDWQPFEHGMSTPSDAWIASALLACVVMLIVVVIVRAFFAGSVADATLDRMNEEPTLWRYIVVIFAFFGLLAVGLAATGVKLW